MAVQLDAGNWQQKPLEKHYHALREKIVPQVSDLVNALAQAGLVTVCAWQGKTRHCDFQVDTAGANGGIQLNCKLEAVGNSRPAPTVKIPGIT
jgi:hypothetical protein